MWYQIFIKSLDEPYIVLIKCRRVVLSHNFIIRYEKSLNTFGRSLKDRKEFDRISTLNKSEGVLKNLLQFGKKSEASWRVLKSVGLAYSVLIKCRRVILNHNFIIHYGKALNTIRRSSNDQKEFDRVSTFNKSERFSENSLQFGKKSETSYRVFKSPRVAYSILIKFESALLSIKSGRVWSVLNKFGAGLQVSKILNKSSRILQLLIKFKRILPCVNQVWKSLKYVWMGPKMSKSFKQN